MLPEKNMGLGKSEQSQQENSFAYKTQSEKNISMYLMTPLSTETIFFSNPKSRTHDLTSSGIFREDRSGYLKSELLKI